MGRNEQLYSGKNKNNNYCKTATNSGLQRIKGVVLSCQVLCVCVCARRAKKWQKTTAPIKS